MAAIVHITPSAAQRIATLAQKNGNPDLKFRISVEGGGCAGFQYTFDLDGTVNTDDQVFTRDNAAVVIDTTSLALVDGSELDYVQDLMGSYFQVKNPQAVSSCGCGTSFSTV